MKRLPALPDSLRNRLSEHAIHVLNTLDIQRDPDWTAPSDKLESILRARGVSVSPVVLDIERVAGGAQLHPGKHFGVFASIRARERRPPLREQEQAFLSGMGIRLQPSAFKQVAGEVLLPLSAGEDPEWSVSPGGFIYFENRDDDYGYVSPAFDSFDQLMETFTFLEHPLFLPEEPRLFQHCIRVDRPAGMEISNELGIPPFPPASGAHCTAWFSDTCWILEQRIQGFAEDTLIGTAEVEIAQSAALVSLSKCRDVEWRSPVRGAMPQSFASQAPPFRREARGGGERYVWGAPRTYDFDFKRTCATRMQQGAHGADASLSKGANLPASPAPRRYPKT